MKGRTLAVLVVVGLAVVGWAVYALVNDDERPERSKPAASAREARRANASVNADADADEKPARRPAEAKAEPEQPAAPRRPPEPPKPNMTVEEAREKFDAYIAELDREIAKSEETDRDLSNEAWVDYYRRGHEAMDPLRRLLDAKNPEHGKEIADKYELVRKKLQQLEPRPNAPPG